MYLPALVRVVGFGGRRFINRYFWVLYRTQLVRVVDLIHPWYALLAWIFFETPHISAAVPPLLEPGSHVGVSVFRTWTPQNGFGFPIGFLFKTTQIRVPSSVGMQG